MEARHEKTKRWSPLGQAGSKLSLVNLAAEFTDIAYNMALIRGLEENWLEFQLKLYRSTTRGLYHAAGRKRSKLHEVPTTVGRNGVPMESHHHGGVTISRMGNLFD